MLLSAISRVAPVKKVPKLYETPLHVASERGDVEVLKLLIKAGADVNAIAQYGTPLHYAVKGVDSSSIFNTTPGNPLETIKLLLTNDADAKLQYDDQFGSLISPLELTNSISSPNKKQQEVLREIVETLMEHTKIRRKDHHVPSYFY